MVVTSYEIVIADVKFLQRYTWKYIVVDEGHRLKNFNCKLLRELRTIPTANKLLLTGARPRPPRAAAPATCMPAISARRMSAMSCWGRWCLLLCLAALVCPIHLAIHCSDTCWYGVDGSSVRTGRSDPHPTRGGGAPQARRCRTT